MVVGLAIWFLVFVMLASLMAAMVEGNFTMMVIFNILIFGIFFIIVMEQPAVDAKITHLEVKDGIGYVTVEPVKESFTYTVDGDTFLQLKVGDKSDGINLNNEFTEAEEEN